MRQRSRRRRLSLTSLIDVIFLLLLFFMLTSTFTRFAEVELSTAGGARETTPEAPTVFAQLGPDSLRINGEDVALDAVGRAVRDLAQDPGTTPVLLALSDGVTAQRLTDALGAFRGIPGLRLTVLGGA